MTYKERYDRLLFSVAILSGGLCAMGLIDAVTNVFIALGTGLYVFYRKFVIRFEIPSSLNFKEKTEYLSRNPGSRFLVFVGKGADTLAMELNLWLHLSIVTLCDALLFVLLYFLNFRSMWFVFVFLTTTMLTYELFCLRKVKTALLSYCLLLAFAAMICVKGSVLIRGLLVFAIFLVIVSISAEFCRHFGKELKKVLFVRIDLPNKNSDYCEITFKNGSVLKFEERGFYPVICDEGICIYSEIESIPLCYSKEVVDSITVVGRDFYKRVKKLEL